MVFTPRLSFHIKHWRSGAQSVTLSLSQGKGSCLPEVKALQGSGVTEPGVYMPVWGCLERQRNWPSSRPGTVRTQPLTCRFSEDQCCAPMESLIAKVIAKSSFFMQSESWCSQPCRIHYSLFPTNTCAVTENFGMVTT